jgi:hypothetical protein
LLRYQETPLADKNAFFLGKHFSRSPVLFSSHRIALILSALLIAPVRLPAQPPQPTQPAAAEAPGPVRRLAPGGLRILVLEGQGVVNSITTKSAISPVIQVLDSLDQPVQGATVTFEVSPTGPGGTFGTAPMATAKSDFNGQATVPFTPNNTPGAFTIKVTASLAGQTATTAIRQANDNKITEALVSAPHKPWYKSAKWWTVIGAGAGAGVAAVILTNGSSTPTITLSPGPVVIGGPR